MKQRPVIFIEVIETNLFRFNLTLEEIRQFFAELNYKSFIFEDNQLRNSEITKRHCDYFFVPKEKNLVA